MTDRPHPDMFVTSAGGGDVIGIGFRKPAAGVDTEALRGLAERIGATTFLGGEDLVRDAADEIDKLRQEAVALRKRLRTARASLDDPQAALDVGPADETVA